MSNNLKYLRDGSPVQVIGGLEQSKCVMKYYENGFRKVYTSNPFLVHKDDLFDIPPVQTQLADLCSKIGDLTSYICRLEEKTAELDKELQTLKRNTTNLGPCCTGRIFKETHNKIFTLGEME